MIVLTRIMISVSAKQNISTTFAAVPQQISLDYLFLKQFQINLKRILNGREETFIDINIACFYRDDS